MADAGKRLTCVAREQQTRNTLRIEARPFHRGNAAWPGWARKCRRARRHRDAIPRCRQSLRHSRCASPAPLPRTAADSTNTAATTTANAAAITAIARVQPRHPAMHRMHTTSPHLDLRRPHAPHRDRAHSRTAAKRAQPAQRPCVAATPAMDRIWIAMAMAWGASRGGGDGS